MLFFVDTNKIDGKKSDVSSVHRRVVHPMYKPRVRGERGEDCPGRETREEGRATNGRSLPRKFIIDFHGDAKRASPCALSGRVARTRGMGPRREKKIESRCVPAARRRVLARQAERAAQGRLITVAFCGFVARHDPRAFHGAHCSAPNRSGNGVGQSFAVGEFLSFVKPARGCVSRRRRSSILRRGS